MKHIFNPVSDDLEIDGVILKEGQTMEMENGMAARFLVAFPDSVVEVEIEEVKKPKKRSSNKPKK